MEAKEREALLNKLEHQRRCIDESLRNAVINIKREAFLVSVTKTNQEKFDELLTGVDETMRELTTISTEVESISKRINELLVEIAS